MIYKAPTSQKESGSTSSSCNYLLFITPNGCASIITFIDRMFIDRLLVS